MRFIAAIVLMLGGTAAHAVTLTAGPLHMSLDDNYTCAVVNVGTTKNLGPTTVQVTIVGSNPGSGTTASCDVVEPTHACTAANTAGGNSDRYCVTTAKGRKSAMSGTFCNRTTGFCLPLQ
jgi:hypothetical protein